MDIIAGWKGLFSTKKGTNYQFTADDRASAAEVKAALSEQKKLASEVEIAKLRNKLEEVKANNPANRSEELRDIIREELEELIPEGEEDETADMGKMLKMFQGMGLMGPPQHPPAAVESPQIPPPSPATPSPPVQVFPPEAIAMVIDAMDEDLKAQVQHLPESTFIDLSRAVWKTLNSSKP